jgi:phosphohistidine phosphatase
MELILWRHAEAEEGIPDSARELTDKGRKQADLMAAWLRPRLPKNTRIIVSPTSRTQQTASALNQDFETVREIGPGVSPEAVLNAAGWPDAKGAVLVVGHQPTLGEVAALLMSGDPAQWTIRKGAIWWFAQKKGDHNLGEFLLQAVVSPDTLQAGGR